MSPELIDLIVALIIAMVLHEMAHALVALWLGDTTAKDLGRITLNPLAHIDPQRSILLPAFLAVSQLATIGHVAFLFGGAKPVPVVPGQLRWHGQAHPRQLMAVVAAAGPASNFILAVLGGFLLPLNPLFFAAFIGVNLAIGLFNLIPLPPLDGGRIAVGLLPRRLAISLQGTQRYGILVLLLVVFILPTALAQAGLHFDPVNGALFHVLNAAELFVLTLTGHAPA
jgi:Zn-dependent protease